MAFGDKIRGRINRLLFKRNPVKDILARRAKELRKQANRCGDTRCGACYPDGQIEEEY